MYYLKLLYLCTCVSLTLPLQASWQDWWQETNNNPNFWKTVCALSIGTCAAYMWLPKIFQWFRKTPAQPTRPAPEAPSTSTSKPVDERPPDVGDLETKVSALAADNDKILSALTRIHTSLNTIVLLHQNQRAVPALQTPATHLYVEKCAIALSETNAGQLRQIAAYLEQQNQERHQAMVALLQAINTNHNRLANEVDSLTTSFEKKETKRSKRKNTATIIKKRISTRPTVADTEYDSDDLQDEIDINPEVSPQMLASSPQKS